MKSTNFGFDEASRKFVKKILARKPMKTPPPLHKELGKTRFLSPDCDKITTVSNEKLKGLGWMR